MRILMRYAMCFVFLFFMSSPAFAQNYRAEIIANMIDPCYEAKLENSSLLQYMNKSQALTLLKAVNQESIEKAIKGSLPILQGQNRKARMLIYGVGKQVCINNLK